MKLTVPQQKVIDISKELEDKYGKGNVFIRWVNGHENIRFAIHQKNTRTASVLLSDNDVINRRVLESLDRKGLITCCDTQHNDNVDPNDCLGKDNGVFFLGSRIKTEVL